MCNNHAYIKCTWLENDFKKVRTKGQKKKSFTFFVNVSIVLSVVSVLR